MPRSLLTDTESLIETAITVAREGGQLLKEIFGQKRKVYFKDEIDLVTDADLRAEEFIVKTIHDRYPEHTIVSEEKHPQAGLSPYKWIIDPLDGTTNYAHGFPWFCVSIALAIHDEPVLGVVYHPFLDQLFRARKGAGAYLNEGPICVSATGKLGHSLLATGFPYNIHTEPEPAVSHFKRFLTHSRGIRRAGSAALDLCYVACGCFDGFWETNLKPWDTAAGALIVREAGGLVTDFQNRPFALDMPEILASNGRLHGQMIAVLQEQRAV
ncbi:MAG: inositol monophosphatase family protein [Thermodesulfobacteriota bacterium]